MGWIEWDGGTEWACWLMAADKQVVGATQGTHSMRPSPHIMGWNVWIYPEATDL